MRTLTIRIATIAALVVGAVVPAIGVQAAASAAGGAGSAVIARGDDFPWT